VRPRAASAPVTAVLAALLVVALLPSGSAAQSLDDVRTERREVQERLDAAGDQLSRTEERVAELEIETDELVAEAAVLVEEVGTLREGMEDRVVALFKRGSVRDPITVFLTSDDPQEALFRAQAVERTVVGDLGQVEALVADQRRLAAVEARLEEQRAELDEAVARQAALTEGLNRDLERARQLEERLEAEEQARREREAREREARERREREARERREQAARDAAAAEAADAADAAEAAEATEAAEAAEAAEAEAAEAAEAAGDEGADDGDDAGDAPASSAPSGGTSDDASGGGGSSSTANGGGTACPVGQPHSFSDTWGAARSGGRSHRGTDILAPYGTSVHAIVDGTWAIQSPGPSAGLWAILHGRDGNQYWYLHLQSHTVGDGASVSAGQQVATNGDTGNARGTPHVHFELHPGGGSAINPYGTLRQAC
jgi:peptidoglycan LD-endopeptidase LytH